MTLTTLILILGAAALVAFLYYAFVKEAENKEEAVTPATPPTVARTVYPDLKKSEEVKLVEKKAEVVTNMCEEEMTEVSKEDPQPTMEILSDDVVETDADMPVPVEEEKPHPLAVDVPANPEPVLESVGESNNSNPSDEAAL